MALSWTKMLKMKTHKSRSYDQSELKQLSDIVCDNIEELLEALDIHEHKMLDKMIIMSCPIHGGDNDSAFNLYHQGDSYRGNWKCRTHQCEETFKSSIIGFVRGCLSRNEYDWEKPGDQVATFKEALNFCNKFVKKDLNIKKISRKEKEKIEFVNTVKYIKPTPIQKQKVISRDSVIKSLSIPSEYYISRKYSKEILLKYDVGECNTQGKEMYNRAVVPIYDIDHKTMVGCSGRSILEESKPKWKHSTGFKADENLYNYWYAKDHIKKTGFAILVESPGNVWRLEEAGIHNSLAIFGASLGEKQKMLLDISGAMTIITIMDNDEAGRKAAQQIEKKCQRTYNVKHIEIKSSDIAEMTTEEITNEIKPLIERYSLC